VRPKPSANVLSPPVTGSCAVATTLPSGASWYEVSRRSASSMAVPSLGVPANPTLAAGSGRAAVSARWVGCA
jgi:hypothetical protein